MLFNKCNNVDGIPWQDGSTPLMIHATSGNVAVVICLLEEHAFMDAQDKVCIHQHDHVTLTIICGYSS